VRPFYPRTLEKVLWSAEEVGFLRGLQVLKDVAKAIRYLHVLGFIHKNVKPGTTIIVSSCRACRVVSCRAPVV
jgi:hypothetical protein